MNEKQHLFNSDQGKFMNTLTVPNQMKKVRNAEIDLKEQDEVSLPKIADARNMGFKLNLMPTKDDRDQKDRPCSRERPQSVF